ncbi:MAG: BrnT family toxin [Bacteroidetes bacterium]|nr:BrnT family toxin [Bacteroidota bacterium]
MSTNTFLFDAGNIEKLNLACEKRKINLSEVIAVFADPNRIILETYADEITEELRFICVGESNHKRIISVIFVLRKGKIRPFNVWQTKGKLKRLYHENKK